MEAVQHIWDDMGRRVRRFVGSKVRDSHVADDIAQDVMLKVQSRLNDHP